MTNDELTARRTVAHRLWFGGRLGMRPAVTFMSAKVTSLLLRQWALVGLFVSLLDGDSDGGPCVSSVLKWLLDCMVMQV